ncbi:MULTISPECIES: sensor histidine kinase [Roseomonadaceae]|uniref:histidine kinase n=1 Tax=Falsiroseomonas oleicola TaxID=2801474 RepID=A0ABS6HB72_9PROT|nr:sensor histidine kinase [Roseomonas oleicola]MBU8545669.1 sensor histidine kinase [Roseomonas oleicola]
MPRPQASLRGRLACLLLIVAFPVVVMVLAGTHAGYQAAIRQAHDDLALERDMVVGRFTSRFATADAALRSLSAIWPEGRPGGRDDCGEWLAGIAPDGVVLEVECAANRDAMPAIPAEARSRLAAASETLTLVGQGGMISLLRMLPTSGRLLVARIATPALPAGLLVWLVDGDRSSWAMSDAAAELGPVAPAAAADGSPAMSRLAGVELVAARGMLVAPSRLVVARRAAPILAAARISAISRLAEVGALLALSLLAVLLGAHYAVTRPLSRLRRSVAQWRSGAAPLLIPGAAEMPDEIRDLAESFQAGASTLAERERDLQAAIDRAEILAAEVHHRVKNNLQIVSSLLALQAQRVTDGQARTEFEAARDRIGALATLHRHMYAHHDPEAIDLGAFIAELGAQLFAAIGDKPGRRIALDVAAPALRISSDQAVPLALIITEAVSAALKQGFPAGRQGRIAITVAADDKRASLSIEDDGVVPRPDDQLRALLLRGLTRQLGAELTRAEAGLALEFPLRPPTPRPPPALRPKAPDSAPPAPSQQGPSAPA